MNRWTWATGVLCAWLAACGGKEKAGAMDQRDPGGAGAARGDDGAARGGAYGSPSPGGPSAGSSGNGPGGTGGVAGGGGSGGIIDTVVDSGPPPASWLVLTISAIARGNGLYVAVGWDVDSHDDARSTGVVYTSPDGFAWTRSAVTFPTPLRDVAFGNGAFVGVALEESGMLSYRSEDGKTWSAAEGESAGAAASGSAFWPRSGDLIAFGNGTFVALSNGGVRRSIDGKDWQSSPHEALDGIDFGAGTFVAWRSAEFASSKNGVDWVAAEPLPETSGWPWNSVRLFGSDAGFQGILGAYCCFGEEPPSFAPVQSDNGSVWQVGAPGRAVVPVVQDPRACITFGQEGVRGTTPHAYATFAVGPSCPEAKPIVADDDYGFYPELALHDGPAYLLAGQPGIYSSKDGVHYEPTLIHAERVFF